MISRSCAVKVDHPTQQPRLRLCRLIKKMQFFCVYLTKTKREKLIKQKLSPKGLPSIYI